MFTCSLPVLCRAVSILDDGGSTALVLRRRAQHYDRHTVGELLQAAPSDSSHDCTGTEQHCLGAIGFQTSRQSSLEVTAPAAPAPAAARYLQTSREVMRRLPQPAAPAASPLLPAVTRPSRSGDTLSSPCRMT